MTTANTLYSGTSLSLAPGTYFVTGAVTVASPTNTSFTLTPRLYTDTTTYASGQNYIDNAGGGHIGYASAALQAIIVLGTTTTVNIGAVANEANMTILATPAVNGDTPTPASGNTATGIVALKLA